MLEQVISNKAGWTRVAFGDVAQNINDYFGRDTDEATRYVSGEHIDEEHLTIHRWGRTDDGMFPPTFKRNFLAGDVLFHSRNIKKIAVPDFDGVTGEKLFVLRSKNERVLSQTYLGFLLSSKHFLRYAEQNWSGSVNKFFNWRPLSEYEFFLPPLSEQARVSAMLKAAWCSLDAQRKLLTTTEVAHASLASELFGSALRFYGEVAVGEICKNISVGIVVRPADHYTAASDGIPALIMKNVQRGWLDLSELNRITPEGHDLHSKSKLNEGDVVAVRSSGSIERMGDAAVVPAALDGCNCIDLLMLRPSQQIIPEYLCHFMNAPSSRQALLHNSAGTMQKHLNVGQLKKVEVPAAPIGEQERIVGVLKESERKREAVATRFSAMRNMFEVLQANWFERVE